MRQIYECPILGYWNIRGLAAGIRYNLEYCGVNYKMEVYEQGDAPDFSRQSWFDKKFTMGLEFPNLPYLIDGKYKLTETLAIHHYIADKWNKALLGRDPAERAKVMMICQVLKELNKGCVGPCYGSGDKNDIKKAYEEQLPPILKEMGTKKFLAGD